MNIMIKLSGESLSAEESVFNLHAVSEYAAILADAVANGNRLYVVTGGGNICRGKDWKTKSTSVKEIVDYIGMLATIQNCLLLKQALLKLGIKSKVVIPSSFGLPQMFCHAEDVAADDQIILLGGGIGRSGYSTDMATVENAICRGCEKILWCKNNTDGVYSAPPTESNAVFLPRLTYKEYLARKLIAVDLIAVRRMADVPHIPSYVFRMTPDNLRAMLNGYESCVKRYTLILG